MSADSLEKFFGSWIAAIADIAKGWLIHIAGKTLRGSKRTDDKYFIRMVSAWCSSLSCALSLMKITSSKNLRTYNDWSSKILGTAERIKK